MPAPSPSTAPPRSPTTTCSRRTPQNLPPSPTFAARLVGASIFGLLISANFAHDQRGKLPSFARVSLRNPLRASGLLALALRSLNEPRSGSLDLLRFVAKSARTPRSSRCAPPDCQRSRGAHLTNPVRDLCRPLPRFDAEFIDPDRRTDLAPCVTTRLRPRHPRKYCRAQLGRRPPHPAPRLLFQSLYIL